VPLIKPNNDHLTDNTLARHTYRGMAYFAGTGPGICADCRFYSRHNRRKNGRCLKFSELMGGKKGETFSGNAAACKYFEPSRLVRSRSCKKWLFGQSIAAMGADYSRE
jgi:hypothetical protein